VNWSQRIWLTDERAKALEYELFLALGARKSFWNIFRSFMTIARSLSASMHCFPCGMASGFFVIRGPRYRSARIHIRDGLHR